MENFEQKSKRRSRLNDRNKYHNLKRNGISRKGNPISNRCNDWRCSEYRKIKEIA